MFLISQKIVHDSDLPTRLQDFVRENFEEYLPSGKSVKKAIKSGAIRVNDVVFSTGYWLKPNDIVSLNDLELNPPQPYELELEIHYCDEHLAVVYKPAGITVSGNQFRTMQNVLVHNISRSKVKDALEWCRPVHRLDNQTQGLLLVARSRRALKNLQHMFEKGDIQKTYHAVVEGKTPEHGTIDVEIDNKSASTLYKRLQFNHSTKCEFLSLLKLHPKTGRTHQIRIHCASMGYPILGDKLYAKSGTIKNKGLFLAATAISFDHPVNGNPIKLEISIPQKFSIRLEREHEMWVKQFK